MRLIVRGLIPILLLLSSAPARAYTGEDWPLLAEGSGLAQGWVSLKVRSEGGRLAVDIHDQGFTSPVTYGLALFAEDGAPITAVGFSAFYATTAVYADSKPGGSPAHVDVEADRYSNANGGGGFTPVVSVTEPTTYNVVFWSAARVLKGWRYRVHGEEGVRILGSDAGSGAFLYQSNDFSGAAQAKVTAVGAGARASVAVDKTIEVRDTLFAWYLQPMVAGCCQAIVLANPNLNAMSVTTPKGERDCLLGCTLWGFDQATRNGPGTYVFHLSGAGAGPLSDAYDVSLIGVDARLPA